MNDYRNFDIVKPFVSDEKLHSFGMIHKSGDIFFVSERLYSSIDLKMHYYFSSNETSDFFEESLKKSDIDSWYLTGATKEILETEDECHMFLKLQIERFCPKIIVALGRKSEKMLLKVKDITPSLRWFETIPHPAFWLTFYSDNKNEYVNILKDIKRKSDFKSK